MLGWTQDWSSNALNIISISFREVICDVTQNFITGIFCPTCPKIADSRLWLGISSLRWSAFKSRFGTSSSLFALSCRFSQLFVSTLQRYRYAENFHTEWTRKVCAKISCLAALLLWTSGQRCSKRSSWTSRYLIQIYQRWTYSNDVTIRNPRKTQFQKSLTIL